MDMSKCYTHISKTEENEIKKQVEHELTDVLFKQTPAGVRGAIVGTAILLLALYPTQIDKTLLFTWYLSFNFLVILHFVLYKFYNSSSEKIDLKKWRWSFYYFIILCALEWGLCIFILPTEKIQMIMFCFLFGVAASYAYFSTGHTILCVVSVNAILLPLMLWCFSQNGFIFYMGFIIIIYSWFVLKINSVGSEWLKKSLELGHKNILVSHQANHDLITGLPNERLLDHYLDLAVKSNKPFGLACFSIDNLSDIVDSYGYHSGDNIIKIVAERLISLSSKLQASTNVEYIITLPRRTVFVILIKPLLINDAEESTKKLFSVLDAPVFIYDKYVKLMGSIGLSLFKAENNNAKTLQLEAETALSIAKSIGNNKLETYQESFNKHSAKHLELTSKLYFALDKHELEVHYQPIIDLGKGCISGMEALARWRHKNNTLIPPNEFIPIAEETGLIIPLGEWVLHSACKQTIHWHKLGFKNLKVSVNLSAKQLQDKNIIQTVSNTLEETGLDSKFLVLELTESMSLLFNDKIINTIKKLKELGVNLAIDDFGTGFSSLSYLKIFTIDKLKIDISFIRDICTNIDSRTIASTIIAMTKELNILSIAEGVETIEQLEQLKNFGCDLIQGYYFSKPLSSNEFTKFLINNFDKSLL